MLAVEVAVEEESSSWPPLAADVLCHTYIKNVHAYRGYTFTDLV